MHMKNIGIFVAAAATALTIGSAASAATIIPVGSPNFFLTSGNPFTPSITAVFFKSYTTSTSFDDIFEFTIPQNGVGSGSISTSFSSSLNKLTISSLTIDGISVPLSSTSSGQSATVGGIPIHTGVLNTIEVIGSTVGAGSFAGNATFQAVPEPATWGMMAIGLGLVGATLRRRRPSLKLA